jgi:plastocyanin
MRRVRWLLGVGVIGLLATACGGGGGTPTTTPTSPPAVATSPPASPTLPPTTAGPTTLVAVDNSFQPSTISVAAGSEFLVKNEGAGLHNFTITGHSSVDIQPGATIPGTGLISSLKPGTYDFFCKYHKSIGMTGTLTIT